MRVSYLQFGRRGADANPTQGGRAGRQHQPCRNA